MHNVNVSLERDTLWVGIGRAQRSLLTLVSTVLVLSQTPSLAEEAAQMASYNKLAAQAQSMHTLLKGGIKQHILGNDAQATKLFGQVLEIDPQNGDAWFNLGVVAEQQGDLDTALKDYGLALRENTGDKELQAAVDQVQAAIKKRDAQVFSEDMPNRAQTAIRTNIMPPTAPSFALSLPNARTAFQHNLVQQPVQPFRQSSRCDHSDSDSGLRTGLLRTTLGVARLLHYDTCSLCGILRGW